MRPIWFFSVPLARSNMFAQNMRGTSTGRGRGRGHGTRGGGGANVGRGYNHNVRPVDIEEQLERCLMEWGVNRDLNEKHEKFWDANLAFVRGIRRGCNIERQPANVKELLPADPIAAVQHVMAQEFNASLEKCGNGFVVIIDRLATDYPGLPNKQAPFAYDFNDKEYSLKEVYEELGVTMSDVDPFERFGWSREPVFEVFRRQYVDEDTGSWSVVARALVGKEACHGAKCVHCGAESLRWNGYSKGVVFRYWKKMVCDKCGSVYEIKTAPTKSSVATKFSKFINNGNYLDAFHAVQLEFRQGAKQYVALLCEERDIYEGVECWPVYFAAVSQVYPQIRAASFCPPSKHAKIYSKFTVETPRDISDNLWFHVPAIDHVD
ncbi:hypothetical protein MPSEU_000986000 [Mayamaea pseudoterrestris]|nr:hypothetical protein MPSEU_000986000 [Mayamaea pseudoterrestris]